MTTPAPSHIPPLTPRRTLFYSLLALYFAWLLALAYLWYTTIHTAPKPAPSVPQILFNLPPEPAPTTAP